MDLFKKKKIKTINNKMIRNTYLSTSESKKQTENKKNRDRIMDMENILRVAKGDVGGSMHEDMRGLRSTNR